MSTRQELDALLAQEGWLRGLATCLVHNRSDADDVVQETWLATLRTPPEAGRPLRPWLGQVMRNLLRMDARGSTRRRAREEHASVGEEATAPSPEALLERLELRQLIAGFVHELQEPSRAVLLLRFFEGRTPAEIARAQGLPAGTVRWQIHQGLERLRERLDQAHGGQRDGWRALLLPLALPLGPGPVAPRAPVLSAGLAARPGVIAVVTVAVLGVAAVALLRRPPGAPQMPTASSPSSARAAGAGDEAAGPGRKPPANDKAKRAAALIGVALPTLAASAGDGTRLTPTEIMDFCIEMREAMVPCKELLADIRSARVPADLRASTRRTMIQEIVDDGTGPLERRRDRCAADLGSPKAAWIGHVTRADVVELRRCSIENDCKMGVACWMNTVAPIVKRSAKR